VPDPASLRSPVLCMGPGSPIPMRLRCLVLVPLLSGCFVPLQAPVYDYHAAPMASARSAPVSTWEPLEAAYDRQSGTTTLRTRRATLEGSLAQLRYPVTQFDAAATCPGTTTACASNLVTLTVYGLHGGWRWKDSRRITLVVDGTTWTYPDVQVTRHTDVLSGSIVSERLQIPLTADQLTALASARIVEVTVGPLTFPMAPAQRADLRALTGALAVASR